MRLILSDRPIALITQICCQNWGIRRSVRDFLAQRLPFSDRKRFTLNSSCPPSIRYDHANTGDSLRSG